MQTTDAKASWQTNGIKKILNIDNKKGRKRRISFL
nr:MAG TPA: hypothetical protein [Caudoviricetes sp.]